MAYKRNRVKQWLAKQLVNLRKGPLYTVWYTGTQRSSIPFVKFQTRVRSYVKRSNWKFRKLAKFVTWHTGAVPAQPNVVVKYLTRRAKKLVRPAIRKLAKFTNWHTGLQQQSVAIRFKTRRAKKLVRSEIRKLARYVTWHTGASTTPTVNGNVVYLKTRKSKKIQRAARKKLGLYTTFHTGIQQSIPQLFRQQDRRRRTLTVSKRKRSATFYINYHTGLTPPPPPVGTRNWLPSSLAAHTRRGGAY